MTEREKVIGFLHETAEYFRECRSNASFASEEEIRFWEMQNAVNEAAELLKEQEAVPVIQREVLNMMYVWCCGSCGTAITDGDKYCRMCGKKMKWNDKTDL